MIKNILNFLLSSKISNKKTGNRIEIRGFTELSHPIKHGKKLNYKIYPKKGNQITNMLYYALHKK